MRLDRKGKRGKFQVAQSVESRYNSQLRALARQIGTIVKGQAPEGKVERPDLLQGVLNKYSEAITPWAASVARYMLADVDRRNERVWKQTGKERGRELRNEIMYAPTGQAFTMLFNEQVKLIKSLPTEAGERVHMLATEGLTTGRRADAIAREIMNTENVTKSRATTIARTEVARASSILTETRARYVGSEGYIWRTAGDGDVRDSHAEMEGKYVRWDTVPRLSDGTRTHAGQIYNCRCYPDPVLPED
jgi:SPP1 gp7 family putative phage head morphogenesis protein